MAEEENKEETEAPTEKKSSNMLLIIIIVVLILLILVGAVVALLMGGDEEDATQNETVEKVQKKSSKPRRSSSASMMEDTRQLSEIGILYPLDTFTVNLKSDAGRRYLKATISLELEGEELSMELDAKTPVLRDRIIRILSSKTLEEISSKKGKSKISMQVMDTLNSMISDGEVRGIYFTEFVIQ
ncbi:MAG: flagellar basal body-associated protein FliL [Sulfurimonas sp.]|nr:flagellar basal body-associated protein FliL [Sulfurimonas sp.]